MATTAAAVVAKARRDVISHFLSRNAVTPDSAVPYAPERRIRARMFERLQRAGVIQAASKGYYISPAKLDAYNRKRRRRIGLILGVAAAAAAAVVAAVG